jgi:hypothetical protein
LVVTTSGVGIGFRLAKKGGEEGAYLLDDDRIPGLKGTSLRLGGVRASHSGLREALREAHAPSSRVI